MLRTRGKNAGFAQPLAGKNLAKDPSGRKVTSLFKEEKRNFSLDAGMGEACPNKKKPSVGVPWGGQKT